MWALVPLTKKLALKNPLLERVLDNGAKRIRTADPLHAMQVLYQLSYGPDTTPWQRNAGHSAWLVALPDA